MLYYFTPKLIRKKNLFIILKVKVTFLLAKQITKIYFYKKEEELYINNIKKIDLISIFQYVKTDKK